MIPLPNLNELDQGQVTQNQAELVERVQGENPTLDLRRGVFADLLAYWNAMLATRGQAGIAAYWKSRSLLALEADPTADPALVDDLLSNYRLDRKQGSRAAGRVTVVVSDDVTVTVARGSVWQARGQDFLATSVFTAKVERAQLNSDSDRLLARTADGNWSFTIDVEAGADGAGAAVAKDSLVVPAVVPPRYVTSFAADDFTPGLDPESNQDLLGRLQQGIAARAMSNRVNMLATLRAQESFSRVVASSIVGFGDPEMQRDRHWIFPVSGGGRCDWYVRTQEQAVRLGLTKTASLVGKNADGTGVWTFAMTRDDAPGFYELSKVSQIDGANPARAAPAGDLAILQPLTDPGPQRYQIESVTFVDTAWQLNLTPDTTTSAQGVIYPAGAVDPGNGAYPIVVHSLSADLSGPGFVPDIAAESTEWVFTRFQTASVTFTDTATDVSALPVGSSKDYALEVICLPLVAEIQDFLSSRDVRPFGSDCLVKAPVPCFVRLNLTVYKRAGEEDPDVAAIKAALCRAVNTVGFVGALYASQLQGAVQKLVPAGQSVSAIDMLGRIRYPDGRLQYLRSAELLRVPDDPASMVSPRTVQFFAGPDDVGVSVVAALPVNP